MKHIFTITTLFLTLFLCACFDQSAGTTDDTDTEVVVAQLVTPAGTPVANASVRVFTYRDSTGIWEDSVSTDGSGNYKTRQLEAGRYTIWAETDSSVLFKENIVINKGETFRSTDTMMLSKSVVIPVKVQPNHDARTVEVQIWGTPIRHNVTKSGHLILDKIAFGTYFTRLTTTLDDYSPTNDTFVVDATTPDTLADTLELIYTGIPVVESLSYTYDTLHSAVNLSWKKSEYDKIRAYAIERKLASSTKWPDSALAHIYVTTKEHPTTFADSLFFWGDSIEYHYQIKILNTDGDDGDYYDLLGVIAYSSDDVKTTITSSAKQIKKNIVGNRASVNDSMAFTVNFSNPGRKLTKIEWFEDSTLLKSTILDSLPAGSDTFIKSWSTIGERLLVVRITDNANDIWEEVIPVSIVTDAPVIHYVDTLLNLNILDTLRVDVSDEFGGIVKYQWDIGGVVSETTDPEYIVTSDSLVGGMFCKVTATDDDGNVVEKEFSVTTQLVWEKVGEWSTIETSQGVYSTNNYIILRDSDGYFWISNDGKDWIASPKPLDGYLIGEIIELDGSFYMAFHNRSEVNIMKSMDLLRWESIYSISGPKPSNYVGYGLFQLINQKLVCNFIDTEYTIYDGSYTPGPIFESRDGVNWIETTKEASVSTSITEFVVHENQLFLYNRGYNFYNWDMILFDNNYNSISQKNISFDFMWGPTTSSYNGGIIFSEFNGGIVHYKPINGNSVLLSNPVDGIAPRHIISFQNLLYVFTENCIYRTK